MNTLPTKAGSVVIEYDKALSLPFRSRDLGAAGPIRIPLRENLRVDVLQGGEQLLIRYSGEFYRYASRLDGWNFFAGQDEQAFVAAVGVKAVEAFDRDGEAGFYTALKPDLINRISALLPEAKVGRQGDIWHIALEMPWEKATGIFRNLLQKESWPIWGTSHVVHGYAIDCSLWIDDHSFDDVCVVEGTLTAPDHAVQELSPGPHVIARSSNLAQADLATMRKNGWD